MIFKKIKQYPITLLALLLIAYLSFMNTEGIPDQNFLNFKGSDLMVHFLMYSFLSFVFFFEHFKNKKRAIIGFHWILLFFSVLISISATVEVLQPIVARRSCEFYDLLANTTGVIWGYIFFRLVHYTWYRLKR
jgi:VanZ family protein